MMLKLRILDMKRFLQVLDTCSTRVQIVEPDGTHSCPIPAITGRSSTTTWAIADFCHSRFIIKALQASVHLTPGPAVYR